MLYKSEALAFVNRAAIIFSKLCRLLWRKSMWAHVCCVYILAVGSYLVYFRDYAQPDKTFWDEGYYVTSAQKYVDGVFFMDMHPPLGKLLIAAGEVILGTNKELDLSSFHAISKIKAPVQGMRLDGFRLLPVLLGASLPLLGYFVFVLLLEIPFIALCFSSFFLFENALVLSSRGALLDAPQMFFVLAALIFYFRIDRDIRKLNRSKWINWAFFGASVACASLVRINGLILMPFFLYQLTRGFSFSRNFMLNRLKSAVVFKSFFTLAFVIVYGLHGHLGKKPAEGRWYGASAKLQEIIQNNQNSDIINIPRIMVENIKYQINNNEGVPDQRLFSADENASRAYFWPFGGRAINYRWDRVPTSYYDVKYLTFIFNPFVLLISLLSLFLGCSWVLGRVFYNANVRDRGAFHNTCVFILGYFAYLATMLSADRVTYLYLYFIPLFFLLIVSALLFREKFSDAMAACNPRILLGIICLLVQLVIFFWFFSPFTYHMSMDPIEFTRRNWFEFWVLRPAL